jgi:iron-sulfur cluster repair protein YtfE (RIC family)
MPGTMPPCVAGGTLAPAALGARHHRRPEDNAMTPMQLLRKDHNAVKRLFTQFNRTTSRAVKKRRELVDKIGTELDIHARIEEEIFYPAMSDVTEARPLVEEAVEEHGSVKELLADIRRLEPDDEALVATLKDLRQDVVHHATEEEREMFPLADRLGQERLAALAQQMAQRKADLMDELMPAKRTTRRAA